MKSASHRHQPMVSGGLAAKRIQSSTLRHRNLETAVKMCQVMVVRVCAVTIGYGKIFWLGQVLNFFWCMINVRSVIFREHLHLPYKDRAENWSALHVGALPTTPLSSTSRTQRLQLFRFASVGKTIQAGGPVQNEALKQSLLERHCMPYQLSRSPSAM